MTRPISIAKVNTVGQDMLGRFHEGGEILCQEPQCSSRRGPVSGTPNKGSPCFQIRKDFGDVGKTERFWGDWQRMNDKRDYFCQYTLKVYV